MIVERYGVFVHVQFLLVCSRSVMVMMVMMMVMMVMMVMMMVMMLTWRADRLSGEGHVEGGLLGER